MRFLAWIPAITANLIALAALWDGCAPSNDPKSGLFLVLGGWIGGVVALVAFFALIPVAGLKTAFIAVSLPALAFALACLKAKG